MRILIPGNLGYVGTALGAHLASSGFEVSGMDSGYYEECTLDQKFKDIRTIKKDVRDVDVNDFNEIDAVVHLAALSNDPIGELDPELTYEINRDAAINVALLAKKAGVARFVFVSTQSIYGISHSNKEITESGDKSPQTAYAKSKWDAEQEILKLASPKFTPVALRPSTVFGWSPRLRSDIVFNNLLISGLTKGVIEVHSDGNPWRPVIHVTDLCQAITLSLVAQAKKVSGESFNVGKIGGNYTVREIAQAASVCLGDIETIFNTENIIDPRSYKVSFVKAKKILGFEAKRELVESGFEMLEKFQLNGISHEGLQGRSTNRLAQLAYLKQRGALDETLRFR